MNCIYYTTYMMRVFLFLISQNEIYINNQIGIPRAQGVPERLQKIYKITNRTKITSTNAQTS